MLNDFVFYGCTQQQNAAITDAKDVFSENVPYDIYPTSDEEVNAVRFNDHFLIAFRLVLSDGREHAIMRMSPEERRVFYAYVQYTNNPGALAGLEAELQEVVVALGEYVTSVVECKDNIEEFRTSPYINGVLDVKHTWDSCPV